MAKSATVSIDEGGSVFEDLVATINGYPIIPGPTGDETSWQGTVPDKAILHIIAVGTPKSSYTVNLKIDGKASTLEHELTQEVDAYNVAL